MNIAVLFAFITIFMRIVFYLAIFAAALKYLGLFDYIKARRQAKREQDEKSPYSDL